MEGEGIYKLLLDLTKVIELCKAHRMGLFYFLLLFFLQNGNNFLISQKEGGKL